MVGEVVAKRGGIAVGAIMERRGGIVEMDCGLRGWDQEFAEMGSGSKGNVN